MSKTFHCPNCAAPLQEPAQDQGIITCAYCHSSVIVPSELRRSRSTEPILTPAESLFNLPELSASLRQAADLTRAGRKEEAVQLLLKELAMDDAEARRIITQMEQGKIVQIGEVENRFSSQAVTLNGEDAKQILELIGNGEEEEALRRYRQLTGAGLEDSRRAIAALQTAASLLEQPVRLSSQQTARIAKGTASVFALSSCLTFLVIALVSLLTFGIVFWALVSDGGPLESWWQPLNPSARDRVMLAFGKQGIGEGTFDNPRHIAVDSQGNIYVSDYRTGRVQQFDAQGNLLNLWIEESSKRLSGSSKPIIQSLGMSRDGILFIVYDGMIHRRNTANGEKLSPLQVDELSISDVYVTSNSQLAVVANGDDLALLNADGTVDWIIQDAIESVAGESELDAYLGGDGLGNFYLAGSFVSGIFKYSPDGKYLNRFGSGGEDASQFSAINAIAVDSQGRIYVSDIKGIMVFSPDGQYLRTINVPGVVFGVDFGQDDRLYTVSNRSQVVVYQVR